MELHIFIDSSDLEPSQLEEITLPIETSISEWIQENKINAQLLSSAIGMSLKVKNKYKLKEPLNFLYKIAKTYKCEFVISMIDPDSGDLEEVCYFGYEEGRPDLFEIANYLSL